MRQIRNLTSAAALNESQLRKRSMEKFCSNLQLCKVLLYQDFDSFILKQISNLVKHIIIGPTLT